MAEDELSELTKEGVIFNDIPYIALYNRYFKNHSRKLRDNIDDQFKEEFEVYIAHLKVLKNPQISKSFNP